MSVSSNVQLKHPTGPWWVINGTAGEIVQQIQQVFPHLTGGPTDFPVIVAQASQEWATLIGATGGSPAAPANPVATVAQALGGSVQGEVRTCVHGTMKAKSGTNAAGKAWSGFFCPSPKGTPDQCAPQWNR